MFSLIIPSYNNLEYLKLCIASIKKNSFFNNEIILHINDGSDGTLVFAKANNIPFSYSPVNAGICTGCNNAVKLSSQKYVVYAHDDMYFLPGWDTEFKKEIDLIKEEDFYLSGTMIENHIHAYGDSIKTFREEDLLKDYQNLEYHDFQGSTWAPTLLPRKTWDAVGGFSEEYDPGTGSDPDLNMKLWKRGVRIFKGLGNCKVYHFGSIVTRQKEKKFSSITETGSKGSKIFLLKWGISIKFFRKFYLKSDTKYISALDQPIKNIQFLIGFLKCKVQLIYMLILKIFIK